MIIKQVRLSQQAKDQLARLKGKTGIKNWNILCRWAFVGAAVRCHQATGFACPETAGYNVQWQQI
jgi:DNA sulfur modification protein DndE